MADICARCGHHQMLHADSGVDTLSFHPVCAQIDADGPCLCRAFKPCDHSPVSVATGPGGTLVKTCACGQHSVPHFVEM